MVIAKGFEFPPQSSIMSNGSSTRYNVLFKDTGRRGPYLSRTHQNSYSYYHQEPIIIQVQVEQRYILITTYGYYLLMTLPFLTLGC